MQVNWSRRARRAIAAAAAAAVLAAMAPARADTDAAIISPAAGEIVYAHDLELAAFDGAATTGDVNWAIRDTCAMGGTNFAGGGPNVSGVDDPYSWTMEGSFWATVDVSGWSAGQYCFIFNPTATSTRLTHEFYLVHDYVEVGGTILGEGTGKGQSPTHALEGLVGDAGPAGIVGSVAVNYLQLGETVVYEATSLEFRAATGIDVFDPTAVGVIGTASGAQILVLDRDASEDFRRGAIVLRAEGSPSHSPYEIDNTPGSTGADSWVAMHRGNNHVESHG